MDVNTKLDLSTGLYKIADALFLDLVYTAKNKEVTGKTRVSVPLGSGLRVNLSVEIIATFVSMDHLQVGVLCRFGTLGHLFIGYNSKTDSLVLFLLDIYQFAGDEKQAIEDVGELNSLKQVGSYMHTGVVKCFMSTNYKAWKEFELN